MRDSVRVQPAGLRLGDAAGAHDPVEVREPLREAAGVGVVVGEARDGPVRAVGQGHEAGRGEDADLAHAAAEQLARAPGAPDEVPAPHDDRADRAGEALGQAERHAVRRAGEVLRVGAERDDGVPEAGAVHVERDAVRVRDLRDRRACTRR